ncbi:MAG: hypothetical protein RMI56_02175 [Sulfolobales archaeon]|nr:hypothetical protein [Sulfolobales archaeon]MDW8082584.1 hypothetical protein [Sulfolobales archaeon]
MKRREARVKKISGKKNVRGRTYTYEYYTLPLNLYIPKSMVEKWGEEYIIERDVEKGTILIKSKKSESG